MTNGQSAVLTILRDCRSHAGEIAAVTRAAFQAHYGSGEGEVAIITSLRADGEVIVELAAIESGEVVGHAMFSRLAAEPHSVRAAALGPVCARIDRQRCGIGEALIRAGLADCAQSGVEAVFVLGDPLYYGRFGFSVAKAAGIACAYSGPHFQALELRPGALVRVKSVVYAPAFAAV
jgi:putative acetyltransferase